MDGAFVDNHKENTLDSIEVKNLNLNLGGRRILRNLNFKASTDQMVFLLGKNGVGKSSLLKTLSLLYPQCSYEHLRIRGMDVALHRDDILREIAFLPENYILPGMKIKRWLHVYKPFYIHFDELRFNRYIGQFSLPLDLPLASMSLGQRKAFYISFVLSLGTPIVFLDEPSNGLDIQSKIVFKEILWEIRKEKRLVIISSHQVGDFENIVSDVAIMKEGEIIFSHSLGALKERLALSHTPNSQVLYSGIVSNEEVFLLPKTDGNREEYLPFDLEFFFVAVYNAHEKIRTHFMGKVFS